MDSQRPEILLYLVLTVVKTVVKIDRIEKLSGILRTDKETDYLLPKSQIDRNCLYIYIDLEKNI